MLPDGLTMRPATGRRGERAPLRPTSAHRPHPRNGMRAATNFAIQFLLLQMFGPCAPLGEVAVFPLAHPGVNVFTANPGGILSKLVLP